MSCFGGVTATISEIHRVVDVENLLHDSLPGPLQNACRAADPGLAGPQAARPNLNQTG
jgi:hypothetical protein